MSENVVIVPYNKEWPDIYQKESKHIRNIFGKNLLGIHHIGSTSVPGLDAKPIVDIIAVVHNLNAVDKCNQQMQRLGYEAKGEHGFIFRRFFVKENRFHIHVFEKGNNEIDRHLKFRDWLRTHPKDKIAYSALKRKLAKKYAIDRTAYTFAKDDFVADIDAKSGWDGIRIVKAYTDSEWNVVRTVLSSNGINLDEVKTQLQMKNDEQYVHLLMLKFNKVIGYACVQFCSNQNPNIMIMEMLLANPDTNLKHGFLRFIEKWLMSRCSG